LKPLKILLIVDDYMPHSIKVAAKMMHDLALELVSQRHEVTVITPRPNQVGKIEVNYFEGVKVIYFDSGHIKNVGLIKRFVNEFMLSFKAWHAIEWENEFDSLDLIVYYSPSIFWASLIKKLKIKYRVPVYLVLRDFFPQWVIDIGLIKPYSLKAIFLRFFEKKNYQIADRIGVMSQKNLRFFKDYIYKSKVDLEVLNNWSRAKLFIGKTNLKSELGLINKVIFFYGGAMGQAQSIQNLLILANRMQHLNFCHFLFLGNGDEVEFVKEAAQKNENISYYESVNQIKYREFLAISDIGMFCLSPEHMSHNFPGKLLGYMEAKLPILGIVNQGNDLKEIVNNNDGGLIFDYREEEDFYHAAIQLANNAVFRAELGQKGHLFLKEFFSAESAVQKLVSFAVH
jgi:O26/O145-antigen biosynthesis N-acetyl-L-fucosamine transferase